MCCLCAARFRSLCRIIQQPPSLFLFAEAEKENLPSCVPVQRLIGCPHRPSKKYSQSSDSETTDSSSEEAAEEAVFELFQFPV